ncbi:MAG: hypothetical protein AAGA92_14595 [Planctomycetota bacterium]
MSRAAKTFILLLAALPSWSVASRGIAAEVGPQIVSLRLGFDGQFKLGCWTPAEVTIAGGDEPAVGVVTVTLPDTDGVPTTYATAADRPVGVAPGGATTVRLLVRSGKLSASAVVRLIGPRQELAKRTISADLPPEEGGIASGLPATHGLTLVFGRQTQLGNLFPADGDGEAAAESIAWVEGPETLPTDWLGYEGVERVVLLGSEPEDYRPLLASRERLRALEEWVRMGGRAVVFCGPGAAELLTPDGALAALAPGDFSEIVQLRDPQSLQTYSDYSEDIGEGRFSVRVPKLTNLRGRVLAHAGKTETDLPLVVRGPLGLGEVTFVGLDIDREPLAGWAGRTALIQKALQIDADKEQQQEDNRTAFGFSGGADLIGQLRNSLDGKFVGVQTVPFVAVAGLVGVYILLIGPGDYFLVSRWLKRAELTWITFPVMVVGVSALAYFLGGWFKGDRLRVNQVELVDVDAAGGGRVRGTVWTHFFSPEVDRFDVTLNPVLGGQTLGEDDARVAATWLGMPGYGLGGLQMAERSSLLASRGYRQSGDRSALLGMPVQVWSTKTLTARWQADGAELVESGLRQALDGELVEGEIVNRSGLDFTDCVLLYGRWAYSLARLPDGKRIVVDDDRYAPRSVRTQLTNASAGDDTTSRTADDGTVPFEWQQNDVSRILKSMMFYKALNGLKYTGGMLNRYQSFVDLSHLLTEDRAVLLARAPGPGSRWNDGDELLASGEDDNDRHWVYYRFVLPVAKDNTSQEKLTGSDNQRGSRDF